jgi:RNA polymerase sigma-70 factor, ECF subfamily
MPNLTLFTDTDLMAQVIQRDQSALAELYRRYGALVYSLARNVLNDEGMAEETTQDIFLKVWNQALTWDPARGKLVSWLLTMTRYTAIDRLRKEQRRPMRGSNSLDEMTDLIPNDDKTEDDLRQDGHLLRALLDRLPQEQLALIRLSFFLGMSHSEIAEKTALPLGTVKTRLRLGMQKLRAMWMNENSDEV